MSSGERGGEEVSEGTVLKQIYEAGCEKGGISCDARN